MVKKRVYELAKELNIENKEIIRKLDMMGISVKSHMSTLEDDDIEKVKQQYLVKKSGQEKVESSEAPSGSQGKPAPEEKDIGKTGERAQPVAGTGREKHGHKWEQKGPGLVDRVPQRPPDRRFRETPQSIGKPPVKLWEQPKKKQDTGSKPVDHARNEPLPGGRLREGKMPQPVTRIDQAGKSVNGPGAKLQPGTAAARTNVSSTAGRIVSRPKEDNIRDQVTSHFKASPSTDGIRVPARPVEKGKPSGEKPKFSEKPKTPFKDKRVFTKGRLDNKPATLDKRHDGRLIYSAQRKRSGVRQDDGKQVDHSRKPVMVIEKKPVILNGSVSIQELAVKLHKRPAELIKKLMQLGVMATINQEVDTDTATILAGEFDFEVEVRLPVDEEALLMQEQEDAPGLLVQRPCVVTVMGHVDHGKTSLLDAVRETNVTATEAGGITQHIGAYQVEHNGKKITFVDTPGHEAFTAMRARGAQVTDVAVLVVAADDGVMPQTIEAINHAKDAHVPIIVAINKIDKPDANPERVKQQLTDHGLVSEEWGGETICVEVSAVQKKGLNDLLEMILLVAELAELKANPLRSARGVVIEAELDKGRGPVATMLVQNGTLHVGDALLAGSAFGRVRAMMDDKGRRIKKAGPSMPVQVLGFSEVPQAGDVFVKVEDERVAKHLAMRRQMKRREEEMKTTARVSLDDFFKHIQEGQVKELRVVVKADVQGSVEALCQSLERLSTDEVKVNIIHNGVGAISETDIMLASASNAIVIGFNVRPDVNARKAAEAENIDVRLYRVIYDAIEDIKAAMSGLLDPEYREVSLGRVEIRKLFKVSKIGNIAGCYVTEGKITRDARVRIVRDGIVVHEGKLDSLKRFKDDVKEATQGYECGLTVEKFNDIQEGDVVEAFTTEAVKRKLD